MSNLVKNWILNSFFVKEEIRLRTSSAYSIGHERGWVIGNKFGLNQGYQQGFNDGLEYEDREDEVEMNRTEWEINRENRDIQVLTQAFLEREQLAEELKNYAATSDVTLRIYPFANRNF